MTMIKYPKTQRVTSDIPLEWMKYQAIVEEKVDGANSAISFTDGKLVLQSRGHHLTGGGRERLFETMWSWAYQRMDALKAVLGERYILFGEWIYAKNRIWYDNLPDHFLAFDMWDKEEEFFLCSPLWKVFMPDSIHCVKVLWFGRFDKAPAFSSLIGPSSYKTNKWKKKFKKVMRTPTGKHYEESETDPSDLMEGVYIKIENDGRVVGRMKLPRRDFEKIKTDDRKWGRRPLLLNQLEFEKCKIQNL